MSDFTNELGVVDPIRPPAGAVTFANRVRRLPPNALGFLLLAVARAVVDVATAVGEFSPILPLNSILGLFNAVPGWAMLLLPVAVAWATQTTGTASRRVVRGSIAIAVSEIVRIAASFISTAEPADLLAHSLVRMFGWLLLAIGLIWLARGLEALRRDEPAPTAQRAALGVLVIGVLAAVLDLGTRLIQLAQVGTGSDADVDGAILFSNVTGFAYIATLVGWAFLGSALLRGWRDVGRPMAATRAGFIAGVLAGLWLLFSLLSIVVLVPFLSSPDTQLLTRSPGSEIYFVIALAARACTVLSFVYLAWGLGAGLGSQGGIEAAE